MKAATVAVLTSLALIASCGGSGSDRGDSSLIYGTPTDIAEALAAVGLGCRDFAPTPNAEKEASTDRQGSCTVERESVDLSTFKDDGQQRDYIGLGESVGCVFAEGLGISEFSFVVGDRWTVTPETRTLALKIAEALGAQVRRIEC